MSYLQNCPAGHHVDSAECPYPYDRTGKAFTVHCIDNECTWQVIAPTKDAAISGWNYLPEKDSP